MLRLKQAPGKRADGGGEGDVDDKKFDEFMGNDAGVARWGSSTWWRSVSVAGLRSWTAGQAHCVPACACMLPAPTVTTCLA
jgi:hypothetical protein